MPTTEIMVQEIIEVAEEALTEWEVDFIGSIESQLSQGRELSERQEEALEKIYNKVCAGPY